MNDKTKNDLGDSTRCSWCGIPFGLTNLVRQEVCVRCYELLKNANLSNEEIFGENDRKREILRTINDNQHLE